MEYITTAERIGIEKGMLAGMQQGMQAGAIKGKLELWNNLLKKESLSKDIIEEAKRNIEDLTDQLKNLSYSHRELNDD